MDLKALGYLISTVSVVLLGLVAWPKPDEPQWKTIALIAGMLASGAGMAVRFLSHRQEKAAIDFARREAEAADGNRS